VAAIATFTLFSLVYKDLEWSALRLAMMSSVFACIGVCLPRAALNMIREMGMDARHRNPKPTAVGELGPVVVLGAGNLGTLLLEHLRTSAHDKYPGMRVLGFIDERQALHGRRLRSFRILGGLAEIPKLAADSGLRGVILAIQHPRKELVNELDRLAAEQDLKIYRWHVGVTEQ
jgi:FlaA1/EpsC-like NDP-sugar epimerase